MKNKFLIVCLSLLLGIMVFTGLSLNPATQTTASASKNFVVYLYPGHSPSNSSKLEATLNERVTIKLYYELVNRGYIVYITNPMTLAPDLPHILTEGPVGDTGAPASQYHFGTQLLPAINTPEKYNANIPKADLCIGIHHNAEENISLNNPVGSANGYEIYYSSTLTPDYNKDSRTVTFSRDMANALDQQLNHNFYLNRRAGAVKDADVNSVTTRSKVPSILLEAGFMTNAYDRSQITQDSNMQLLATRIADAVDAYSPSHLSDNSPPTLTGVSPSAGSWVSTPFTLTANGVSDPSGVKSVRFAVWSEKNGQDDLRFYNAANDGNGNWSAIINAANHNYDKGNYRFDVRATDGAGNEGVIAQSYVYVFTDKEPPTLNNTTPNAGTTVGQTFTLTANGVSDPNGVETVYFAVWSKKNNQSDMKLYYATNDGGGNWSVNIDTKNFNYVQGDYYVDVHAIDGRGNEGVIDQLTLNVDFSISGYDIMGNSNTDAGQLVRYYQSSGCTFPSYYSENNAQNISRNVDLNRFCQIYMEECAVEGVRAEVAFAQAMNETGWLQFGGMIPIEYLNFAGLGAFDGQPVGTGANFAEKYGDDETGIRMGIRAQVQHLKCYASTAPLNNNCVDPRFDAASAKYGRGSATTVESLGGKWATSPEYGIKIMGMVNNLLKQ